MRTLVIFLLPLLLISCTDNDPLVPGASVLTSRLVAYDIDVDVSFTEGEDNTVAFLDSDSTFILQITRTVDPNTGVAEDERFETIYLVLPNDLTAFMFTNEDWADLKTFAFRSGQTIEAPVGRIVSGTLAGQWQETDGSWFLNGSVEVSEDFGPTFPSFLTGQYDAL